MAQVPTEAGGRRLEVADRRDQLERIAMSVAAERGYTGTSLEEVAERAGVTRNLLYHYFPRGRLDLFLAAVDRSGRELAADWVVDESIPLAERLNANLDHILDHALAPSEAWLMHRQASVSGEPEVERRANAGRDILASAIALNQLGTRKPPAIAKVAIRSFISFAETALDECRERNVGRERARQLLTRVMQATAEAVRESGSSPGRGT